MKYLLILTALTTSAYAMGRLPSDPATWGDVQNVKTQVNNNYATEQSDNKTVNDRIDNMQTLKVQIGTTVRLYDAKYASLNLFSFTDVQGSGGNAVGFSFGFKLGKSYEEKQIDKLQKQITFLLENIKK